jgi:hypothetical protein
MHKGGAGSEAGKEAKKVVLLLLMGHPSSILKLQK